MYKIVVSKEGEQYDGTLNHPPTYWKNVYEQDFETLDVNALAVWLNSQPKKRSHKKKAA